MKHITQRGALISAKQTIEPLFGSLSLCLEVSVNGRRTLVADESGTICVPQWKSLATLEKEALAFAREAIRQFHVKARRRKARLKALQLACVAAA